MHLIDGGKDIPNACTTSGIESKAGCAGVGFDRPFASLALPLTADESSATMLYSSRCHSMPVSSTSPLLKHPSSHGFLRFRLGAMLSRAIVTA
jgi:hypothetical protein